MGEGSTLRPKPRVLARSPESVRIVSGKRRELGGKKGKDEGEALKMPTRRRKRSKGKGDDDDEKQEKRRNGGGFRNRKRTRKGG
jgi:hypothetical protein